MAAAAPFSRLQLAAALLEYDNDPEDPYKPVRNAKESALFIPFRSTKIRPEPAPRRSSDFLGVNLPSDAGGSTDGRRQMNHSRGPSRASTNALAMHNPFRASVASANMTMEDTEEGGGGAGEMEIDLSSWGVDSLIVKDKDAKGKGKAKSVISPSEQPPLSSVSAHLPRRELGVEQKPTLRSRAMSLGDFDQHIMEEEEDTARPKSYASPLDLVGMAPQKLRSSSFSGPQTLQQSVPFPSRSPAPAEILPLPADPDDLDARPALHQRTHSSASWDSKFMLRDEAVAKRGRSNSNATMNSMNSKMLLDDQNPFALRPPSVASRFDPKAAAHARTLSNATLGTLGTRMMMDNDQDAASMYTTGAPDPGAQRFSTTLELLRPKVLVMPSPLQNAPVSRQPDPYAASERNGFTVLTDGKPLPPGAKSARPRSAALPSSPGVPIASNSFTPNPRMNLTNSQLMFRNALTGADGQRDVTYEDIDGDIPRATQDGQQVYPFDDGVAPVMEFPEAGLELIGAQGKPPGKLYGKSLIDDLESRKLALKNKQRTFRGDDRPSMMSRSSQKRASTLIDPATLSARPTSQNMDSFNSSQQHTSSGGGVRRGTSGKRQTLLDFEGEKLPEKKSPVGKSVFGVDTLWEREMLKLKEMEAQERADAEEKERREALKEAREDHKRKSTLLAVSPTATSPDAPPRISAEPPLLPEISRTPKRPPPGAGDGDDGDESEEELDDTAAKRPVETTGWNAGSSSDEEGPRRTTGTGLRVKQKQKARPTYLPSGEDSDEDIPLAATIGKVAQRATFLRAGNDDDSDEESKPLSMLLRKASKQSSLLPNFAFQNSAAKARAGADDESDDEQPLGLRASRMPNSMYGLQGIAPGADQDEDELPLAFHPEQQKRQQVQQQQQQFLMAQQQQQMMMQSMYMNPMMGSGYFNPMAPMGPMPTMPPVQVPSPPPIQDPAKIGRVDRWRHDVAVEGE